MNDFTGRDDQDTAKSNALREWAIYEALQVKPPETSFA
jgi:hypothetical protein